MTTPIMPPTSPEHSPNQNWQPTQEELSAIRPELADIAARGMTPNVDALVAQHYALSGTTSSEKTYLTAVGGLPKKGMPTIELLKPTILDRVLGRIGLTRI